jgi:CheY-like chemotaxis protein
MPKTILLADDSVTIRKVVELTFSDSDLRVESASTGREALELLEALRPDLVLADVVMPEPAGYEICRRVKGSPRPVPVILLAGTFEPFDRERARAVGADDHLSKPFESEALRAKVIRLLEAAPAPPALRASQAGGGPGATGAIDDPPAARGASAEAREGFPPEMIDRLARAVARHLAVDVVREVARDVVPRVAERLVRERLRELEEGEP